MSFTIAVAGSRGKLSAIAVEQVGLPGDRLKNVVRSSTVLPASSPQGQLDAVLAVERAVIAANGGEEPLIIVSYSAAGATLYGFLVDDYRTESRLVDAYGGRPRLTRPMRLTHTRDGGAEYVPLNHLAANLARAWRSRRLEFAPGLDLLERQVASFAPVETKAGTLVLDDEADAYDGQVVALMYSLARRYGRGPVRYLVGGKLWPSADVAVAHLGQAALAT